MPYGALKIALEYLRLQCVDKSDYITTSFTHFRREISVLKHYAQLSILKRLDF